MIINTERFAFTNDTQQGSFSLAGVRREKGNVDDKKYLVTKAACKIAARSVYHHFPLFFLPTSFLAPCCFTFSHYLHIKLYKSPRKQIFHLIPTRDAQRMSFSHYQNHFFASA